MIIIKKNTMGTSLAINKNYFEKSFVFFGSRYHFSKIFGYNAPHNTLVSAWHVMTDTRKHIRKGILFCFLSFLDTLYIVNTK